MHSHIFDDDVCVCVFLSFVIELLLPVTSSNHLHAAGDWIRTTRWGVAGVGGDHELHAVYHLSV